MTDEIDTAANPETAPQDDKATAPAAPAADPKTIVASGGDDVTDPPASDKPADDWRVRLAAGDEKELKRLGRFASEGELYKAYRELEKKKSSGELKSALPKDATPEQLADWRKSNGIPEAPDKYDLAFDNGLVIGEEDKPLIDKFVASMHGENATPAQVKAAISSYYALIGEQQQARAENDVAFKDETKEVLREEWQGDYKKNLAVIDLFLDTLPQDTRLAFENARTADGNLIGNDPAIIKWLAETAYKINPAASVMPNSVSNPGAAIGDEIAALEKMIGDRDSDYWKGPNASKNQSRYLSLIDARDKIAARG